MKNPRGRRFFLPRGPRKLATGGSGKFGRGAFPGPTRIENTPRAYSRAPLLRATRHVTAICARFVRPPRDSGSAAVFNPLFGHCEQRLSRSCGVCPKITGFVARAVWVIFGLRSVNRRGVVQWFLATKVLKMQLIFFIYYNIAETICLYFI